MTTEIHLSKEDIRQLIAQKYDVSPEQVDVICFMDCVGYGLGERNEPNVRAVVKTN